MMLVKVVDWIILALHINGKTLESVESFKYLGIVFSRLGKFQNAIKFLLSQGNRAMFSVLNKATKLNLEVDTKIELFDRMVTPILTYIAKFGDTKIPVV